MNLTNAHLRVARPTDKLVEIVKFYKDGLGFECSTNSPTMTDLMVLC